MNRLSQRTPQSWSRFDFFALIIVVAFGVLLLVLWLGGLGPNSDDCCDEKTTDTPMEEYQAPTPTSTPSPEPYLVIISSSAEGVSVTGVVDDEETRGSILSSLTALSADSPASSLKVAENIETFDSSYFNDDAILEPVLALLPSMDRSQLSIDPQTIKLSGEVSNRQAFDTVSATLDGLNAAGYKVINDVRVMAIPSTTVTPLPTVDCQKVLRASEVEFAFASANLTPAGKSALRTALGCLASGNYFVVGHTDSVGNDEANMALSLSRARAARDFLISEGIAASRLEALGRGESEPIATNNSEAGRSQNRRIEFLAR